MEHAEFTIQIRREVLSTGEDIYVALCLELDIASQGTTLEQAKANVADAIESFFEVASPAEIEQRLPFRAPAYADAVWTGINFFGELNIAKQITLSLPSKPLTKILC